MSNILEFEAEKLNKLIDVVRDHLPKIDSSKNYWFIRANQGEFYESFLLGNYIAIGWNFITIHDLENLDETSVKGKLQEFDNKIKKPGSAYKQMMRFVYELQIGDFVIVPSQAPNNLLVGEIISEAYTETLDKIESATNSCPYNKRRDIKWSGVIRNQDIDSHLYKLVYAGHTVSDANLYKKYINRGLYDAYIDNNQMSMTFKVQEENNINAFAYSSFLYQVLRLANVLQEEYETHEKIVLRTNVQSKGPIEFIGSPEILVPVLTFISLLLAGYRFGDIVKRNGGKIKIDFKSGKAEASLNSDGDEAIKKASANKIKAEALQKLIEAGATQELIYSVLDLELDPPKKATQIIESEMIQTSQSEHEYEETDE